MVNCLTEVPGQKGQKEHQHTWCYYFFFSQQITYSKHHIFKMMIRLSICYSILNKCSFCICLKQQKEKYISFCSEEERSKILTDIHMHMFKTSGFITKSKLQAERFVNKLPILSSFKCMYKLF